MPGSIKKNRRLLKRIPSCCWHIHVHTQCFAILTHESAAGNDNFAQDQDLVLISVSNPFDLHFSDDVFAWNSNYSSFDWSFIELCTFPIGFFINLGHQYHDCFDCFSIVICKKKYMKLFYHNIVHIVTSKFYWYLYFYLMY